MIPENYKNYLALIKQIPQFIRDEEMYETFVYFIQAYYDWLSQPLNIEDRTKNLLNYKDVDKTLDEFEQFFFNEFLQYFPEETLVDKRNLVKFSKEVYRRKSTPASFKFLFRAIYGSDCETVETEQFVLKASDGKWAASRTVKLDTLDSRFLRIDNYLLFGETSKAVAKIEKSQVASKKIEIYLSDINRNFISGESVRVVDSNLNDVIIDGSNLVSKIVGLVKSITVDEKFKGLNYKVNDPVLLFDGLNEDIADPIGATARVGAVNEGTVSNITLSYGSQGFRPFPESELVFTGGGDSVTQATALITGIDISNPFQITNLAQDVIFPYRTIPLNSPIINFSGNPTGNANTKIANALTFTSFTTYPIANVALFTKGSGYTSVPEVNALSNYNTVSNNATIIGKSSLDKLGILGEIEIVSGGSGYQPNDKIIFIGGSGTGAFANVSQVDALGAITKTQYIKNYLNSSIYPLGGMGYYILPELRVTSGSGNGAVLVVNSVVGDGEIIKASTDNIGMVERIDVIEEGEDYVTTPKVSLRVLDAIVSGISRSEIPERNTFIYQGSYGTPNFRANTYSFDIIDEQNDYFLGRFFNYSGTLDINSSIYFDKNEAGDKFYEFNIVTSYNDGDIENGINFYGNGRAKANANLLTGTTAYGGRFLNEDGHLSSYCRLQNEVYNNYTYFIDTERSFSLYKELVRNLLNPAGSQFVGKHIIKTKEQINSDLVYNSGKKLANLTNFANSSANAVIQFTESYGGNIVKFNNILPLISANNLSDIISTNTKISLKNNSISVSTYKIIVTKESFINDFPQYGSVIYQGNANSPSFYGKYDSAIKIKNYVNLYEVSLFDCYGVLDYSQSSSIYSDLSSVNDKFYYFDIQSSYQISPFINGHIKYNNRETYYSTVSTVYNANNSIVLKDYYQLLYNNVFYGYTFTNTFIITELTDSFDKINNGDYSSNRKLKDIIFKSDTIVVGNNSNYIVEYVDYEDGIIYCNTNLISIGNVTNPVTSNVKRNFNSNEILLEN